MSSLDVATPFRAETDLGHYLLYADEVREQRHLLIDDPFAGEPDRVFADPQAAGAVYGEPRATSSSQQASKVWTSRRGGSASTITPRMASLPAMA